MCVITRVSIVLTIIILVASGCVSTFKEIEEEGDNNMAQKEEILKLVNNDSSADDLIKTIYPEEDLKDFFRLSTLLREQPPECVRYVDERIYFVYKYQEEAGYLFLAFNSIDNDVFPSEWWYTDKKLYLKDFEKLAEAKAFSEDVKDLDPHGNYLSFYASSTTELESIHFTLDGYMVIIYYGSVINVDFGRIKKLTVLSGKDNPMYYNLLPIDKELLMK